MKKTYLQHYKNKNNNMGRIFFRPNRLNEGSVSVRGTRKSSDIHPVPYDDDYVDRFGATKPRDEYKSENEYIEKYADSLAQRLEYAFKQQGVNSAVEVSEDIENSYYHENDKEFETRLLRFIIVFNIRTRKDAAIKILQCATIAAKMFSQLEIVDSYAINLECDDYGHQSYLNINAYVKPDKNGMKQLEKNPSWYPFSSNTKYRAHSRYQEDEE